jgi:hypothetical protein
VFNNKTLYAYHLLLQLLACFKAIAKHKWAIHLNLNLIYLSEIIPTFTDNRRLDTNQTWAIVNIRNMHVNNRYWVSHTST